MLLWNMERVNSDSKVREPSQHSRTYTCIFQGVLILIDLICFHNILLFKLANIIHLAWPPLYCIPQMTTNVKKKLNSNGLPSWESTVKLTPGSLSLMKGSKPSSKPFLANRMFLAHTLPCTRFLSSYINKHNGRLWHTISNVCQGKTSAV